MRKIVAFLFVVLTLGMVTIPANATQGQLYGADRLLSSRTLCVVEDHYGFIWLGTENGLNRFDGYNFTSYRHSGKNNRSLSGIDVICLYLSKKGELWVGTGSGICRYNYATDDFDRIELPVKEKIHISYIDEASDGTILACSAGYGIFRIMDTKVERIFHDLKIDASNFCNTCIVDKNNTVYSSSFLPMITSYGKVGGRVVVKSYQTGKGSVSSFLKDGSGGFFAFCSDGILSFDPRTKRLSDAGFDLSALAGAKIKRGYRNRRGDLLIGTRGNGAFIIEKGTRKARAIEVNGKQVMGKSTVNWFCEDHQGNLWLSCYQAGMYRLSANTDVFGFWSVESASEPQGSILSAIAPFGNGLLGAVFQDGIYSINSQGSITSTFPMKSVVNSIVCDDQGRYWACGGHSIWQYHPEAGVFKTVSNNSEFEIWHMAVDNKRQLLYYCEVGNALGILDLKTMKTTELRSAIPNRKDKLNCSWIQNIMVDHLGLVWISTADGVSCYNPETKSFMEYGWVNILTHYLIFACCEDKLGNIIIGSNEGLFYFDRLANKVSRMEGADELLDLQIFSIILDQHGDAWMSTSAGIWHYDCGNRRFTSYLQGNGLEAKQYVQDGALSLPDGRLVFGTDKGAVVFSPDQLLMNRQAKRHVSLSRFLVDERSLDFRQNEFTIPAGSTSFSLEMSVLDYVHPEYVTYQYRLDKDSTWHSAPEGVNTFTFSKMRAGSYILELRALVNGSYSDITTLCVDIEAPWYATKLAKFLYFLMFLGIVYIFYRNKQRRLESQYEEQKMRFLINATHDIRSPLTLITGPLAKLKEKTNDRESQRYIDIIQRNAERMLALVNQILDVRKIDMNQMQIHCRKSDIVGIINGIVSLYRFHLKERNITLTLQSNKPAIDVYLDRTNFEKVVSNLLSNAVKYTPDGGEVNINIDQNENNVVFTIEDNGVGMAEEDYKRIFERFYQSSNSRSYSVGGTGIGLNLCKQLVEMHHGSISAGPRQDGAQGTRFTVSLPLGSSHLSPEQIEDDDAFTAVQQKRSRRDMKILVADDDAELASYVKMELGVWYSVTLVKNGQEALSELLSGNYDLLLSDVIMPVMDGITLLKSVKQNPNISHVPVILLTSKAEVEDRLKGIESGADAFIAKPFSISELHITIDNLINNVRRLRGKFSGLQSQDDKIVKVEMEDNDKMLMDKITRAVNENYTNSDYGVEQLAEDVGLSRVQLHRKMKQLTGIASSDFIRNIRLKQAAQLIKENQVNISQVAYAVGFNSHAHFSTLFKKYYGCSPSEYGDSSRQSAKAEEIQHDETNSK